MSVICAHSGWPANVTCVEFKEIQRGNVDEVVSDSNCEKIVSRLVGINLEECDPGQMSMTGQNEIEIEGMVISTSYVISVRFFAKFPLTFTLLTWRIWLAPHNASRWQVGINSAFKGLS